MSLFSYNLIAHNFLRLPPTIVGFYLSSDLNGSQQHITTTNNSLDVLRSDFTVSVSSRIATVSTAEGEVPPQCVTVHEWKRLEKTWESLYLWASAFGCVSCHTRRSRKTWTTWWGCSHLCKALGTLSPAGAKGRPTADTLSCWPTRRSPRRSWFLQKHSTPECQSNHNLVSGWKMKCQYKA